MNTIDIQLNHRTVREFTDQKIDDETLNKLLEVCNRTANSTGMQSFSIVRVLDEKKRKEIAEVSTQEYLARCPELFIFIADLRRNAMILKEQNADPGTEADMDRFFQGFTDACLAAQNLTVAAESLGMGAVYFGSILNDYDRIIEILNLPPLTFPVIGVGFGYPNQEPQLKPRINIKDKVFIDEYKEPESYLEAFKDYDQELTNYYDTRENGRRSDSFYNQVIQKYNGIVEKRRRVMDSIVKQGFNLRLEK